MWQPESFDPATIERELVWAAGLGMNAVRVYLHDLLYEGDAEGFLDRLDRFLALADKCGIGAIPVLFDGVWHPAPKLGKQPDPRPRIHNSIWVQSPGNRTLLDRSSWPDLRPYVDGVIRRFAEDQRIIAWDLFNEPDQMDATTMAAGSRDEKAAAATALADCVFDWAREVNPSQPLTVGVWEYDADHRTVTNPLNELALERSDVVTFHCYEPGGALTAVIDKLSELRRPLICTEWLARTAGSTIDLLEIFADKHVGAINWGLVDGRTQTRFPWRSWQEDVPDDEPWFHELLHADGTPYDEEEIALIRRVVARKQI